MKKMQRRWPWPWLFFQPRLRLRTSAIALPLDYYRCGAALSDGSGKLLPQPALQRAPPPRAHLPVSHHPSQRLRFGSRRSARVPAAGSAGGVCTAWRVFNQSALSPARVQAPSGSRRRPGVPRDEVRAMTTSCIDLNFADEGFAHFTVSYGPNNFDTYVTPGAWRSAGSGNRSFDASANETARVVTIAPTRCARRPVARAVDAPRCHRRARAQ